MRARWRLAQAGCVLLGVFFAGPMIYAMTQNDLMNTAQSAAGVAGAVWGFCEATIRGRAR